MPGKAELRAEWNNAGKDVVVLHMMDRGRTRPNISPFALKFETFLKVMIIRIWDHDGTKSEYKQIVTLVHTDIIMAVVVMVILLKSFSCFCNHQKG